MRPNALTTENRMGPESIVQILLVPATAHTATGRIPFQGGTTASRLVSWPHAKHKPPHRAQHLPNSYIFRNTPQIPFVLSTQLRQQSTRSGITSIGELPGKRRKAARISDGDTTGTCPFHQRHEHGTIPSRILQDDPLCWDEKGAGKAWVAFRGKAPGSFQDRRFHHEEKMDRFYWMWSFDRRAGPGRSELREIERRRGPWRKHSNREAE